MKTHLNDMVDYILERKQHEQEKAYSIWLKQSDDFKKANPFKKWFGNPHQPMGYVLAELAKLPTEKQNEMLHGNSKFEDD